MNPATVHDTENCSNPKPAFVVRRAIATLNSLDSETADHLNALAFVLMRVARADGRVCNDERLRMEDILTENAGVPTEHAVLVIEIACHRAKMADCGNAYAISRDLRSRLSPDQQRSIIGLLTAVASADGCLCTLEHREIFQIAGELGISPHEVTAGLPS